MFEQLPGLVASPRPITLHVDRSQTDEGLVYGWHIYDKKSDKRIYIAKPALEGQLLNVSMFIQVFQNKENYKVSFTMQAGDRVWNIKSGVETIFTRGIVQALIMMKDQLEHLPTITILAEPGDTAVYGSVWMAGTSLRPERDDDVKLFPLIQEIQKALGKQPQTMESIKADFEAYRSKN